MDDARPSDPWTQREEEGAEELLLRAYDTPSVTRSIADAVVLKEGDLYFLTNPDGRVPLTADHGFGLYYHDCRYLDGYELCVAGLRPDALVSTTTEGFKAVFQLTLPDVMLESGDVLPKEHLGIKSERVIHTSDLALHDLLTFHNYGVRRIRCPVALTFRAGFDDIFVVRGVIPQERGQPSAPQWEGGTLRFTYLGADEMCRELTVHFSPEPAHIHDSTAEFLLALEPGEPQQVLVSMVVSESTGPCNPPPATLPSPNLERVAAVLQRSSDAWLAQETRVVSNSLELRRAVNRSLRDLRVLRSRIGEYEFFAAGVPWFATLFGRDSLVTALQTLAFDPHIAEQTLRVLAQYQGERENPWRDEQPGKILHELRVGELARTGQIPHTPYYGTIDATILFLILVGRHAAWTGSLALFHELRANIERALDWMAQYGDLDGDGYISYVCQSSGGLANQGWKDAGDAIVNRDGSLAVPPITLVEVQGYAYLARTELANLYERAGDSGRAAQLRQSAADLKERFNRDFWLMDEGFFALALQAEHRPCAVRSSNPGQALWTGIVDPDKAAQTVEQLMAGDMFSGWGIRTLSTRERRYNPISYQLGSIWPHDNSLIAAGFRRYGYAAAVERVFEAVIEAAIQFPDDRLPELFTGFPRDEYGVPVSYPVACRPQAWAAGAVPHLLESLLGLSPEAFASRLCIRQPVLPQFVDFLELHSLRVGQASVDLRFERTHQGSVAVDVLALDGDLEVVVELGPTPLPTVPIAG